MKKIESIEALFVIQDKLRKNKEKQTSTLTICGGTGCQAGHSMEVVSALKKELSRKKISKKVGLTVTGCHGFCEQGPILIIEPGNVFYCHVSPSDVAEIIEKTVLNDEIVERLLYVDPISGKRIIKESEIPFYTAQDRQLLSKNRLISPTSIEDYLAIGGYSALAKVLSGMSPEEIIKEIANAGLRGRGGGGFPTARKWDECRNAPGKEKYVICNADEGDPGAYMDRCLLEGNPHSVLEGMAIGAMGSRS